MYKLGLTFYIQYSEPIFYKVLFNKIYYIKIFLKQNN